MVLSFFWLNLKLHDVNNSHAYSILSYVRVCSHAFNSYIVWNDDFLFVVAIIYAYKANYLHDFHKFFDALDFWTITIVVSSFSDSIGLSPEYDEGEGWKNRKFSPRECNRE